MSFKLSDKKMKIEKPHDWKKKKGFKLSDKIDDLDGMTDYIMVEDVKEFIRLLKEEMIDFCETEEATAEEVNIVRCLNLRIDKLAGEELI